MHQIYFIVRAVLVFYYALLKYLQNDLERVQKRAFSIIFPGLAYNKALEVAGIQTISDYKESICGKTFKYISNNTSHRLRKLLPTLNPRTTKLFTVTN